MMRSFSRASLLIGMVLLAATISRPATASCAEPHRIDSGAVAGQQGGPYLVSNPEWRGAGGDRTCTFGYGCYDTESAPPISADLFGVFWALETGDPAVGVGDDNGAWIISGWSKQSSTDQNGGVPLPGGLYHYPAWLTRPDTPAAPLPNAVAGYAADWSDTRIDGCVANAGATPEIDGTECTCVLLNDQWTGIGYFGLLSALVNGSGDFDVSVADAIRLAAIPRPRIMWTERTASFDVEVDVLVDPVTEGVYEKDGCNCGLGYKVYAHLAPLGDSAPVDRSEGWHEPPAATGGAQAIVPLGQQTAITIDCSETTPQGFYLSVRLFTDDGFATRFGSENSFWVECSVLCNDLDDDGDGVTECEGDCDDSDPSIYPGAPQSCDGRNNDCSTLQWPALTGTNEFDDDADMQSECEGDCDDTDREISPAALETCNGIDDNCNGLIDEDAEGEDSDGDGIHNLCDNCRDDRNPTQTDVDLDFVGDVCDLDDGMIYIRFHQPEYVEWQAEAGYTQWNCYRGDLAVLRDGGAYTQDLRRVDLAERYCGETVPWVLDPEPPSGEAVFFLTTGLHPESDLGTNSDGSVRPNENGCP